jgi:hypothetical protein
MEKTKEIGNRRKKLDESEVEKKQRKKDGN